MPIITALSLSVARKTTKCCLPCRCRLCSTSPIESVTVKAEDRLNTGTDKTSKTYKFELKYAEPEINANIDSFKLGKYEGTISGTNINVRVPYNTDLKGMIATFTTSTGAKVLQWRQRPVEERQDCAQLQQPHQAGGPL